MTISEKVAYLKGMAEGMELDTVNSKEGKLINVMIGILEEIGMSIEDLEENMETVGEEIDALSDDLSDVEEVLFEEEDDEEEDCGCGGGFVESECPKCGEMLAIDVDALEAGVIQCPNCKGELVFSDSCCDDDDCGCGCDHDHK